MAPRKRRKVWVIVTKDGELGEGPWADKADAEDFLENEVGVAADLLKVYEDSLRDIRSVQDFAHEIREFPHEFRGHLP